jgi:hypothetical protein
LFLEVWSALAKCELRFFLNPHLFRYSIFPGNYRDSQCFGSQLHQKSPDF